MKKLLLLLLLSGMSYARDINDTMWKQTYLNDDKNYSVLEFNENFYVWRIYKDGKLEDIKTYNVIKNQIVADLIFVWLEGHDNPEIFKIRGDLKNIGETVLLYYGYNTKNKNAWVNLYLPFEGETYNK